MILIEVKHLHQKDGLWVLPYVRKTRTKTLLNFFTFKYYQEAKRRKKQMEKMILENNGIYISKKEKTRLGIDKQGEGR